MSYILSKSGRKMPCPKNKFRVRLDSNRKCINDIKEINQWLIDQTIAECKSNNDDYNLCLFKDENVKNLPDGSIALMNLYLFGDADGVNLVIHEE